MSSSKKIFLSHTFDASPQELWDAWTDPEQFAQWFNPAPGFNLIIHEFDVRKGGKIKFDMPQPNGDLNTQEGIFHTLNPYKEILSGALDKSFLIHTSFEQRGKQTKMVVEVSGIPPEFHSGALKGWNAGFKKLELLLQKISKH